MKKIYVVLMLVFALTIIGIAVSAVEKKAYTESDAWNELLALEPDITMDDLREKGYIDVSQVMDSKNAAIMSFLESVNSGQKSILRIADIKDGKLCCKILMYRKESDSIVMWTIYPNRQQAESPGRCFDTDFFAIEDETTINIWLKGIPNASFPDSETTELVDEKLYSYFKK